jgi:hypothetical protein
MVVRAFLVILVVSASSIARKTTTSRRGKAGGIGSTHAPFESQIAPE